MEEDAVSALLGSSLQDGALSYHQGTDLERNQSGAVSRLYMQTACLPIGPSHPFSVTLSLRPSFADADGLFSSIGRQRSAQQECSQGGQVEDHRNRVRHSARA